MRGVDEAAVTDVAGVGHSLSRPRLWPLIQEDYPGAVYNVGLDSTYVQYFLYLRYPNHVVVGRPPYL